MLTYADIPLTVVTPEMAESIETHLSIQDIYPWDARFLSPGRGGFGLLAQEWYNRPPKIGRLLWPTGASRWAIGLYVVTGDQLDEIQSNIEDDPAPLVIGDGDTSVTAYLKSLAPRQLVGIPYVDGLWLLPLVDSRYFLWQLKTGNIVIDESVSWNSLFLQVAEGAGIDLTGDEISDLYGTAPITLTGIDEPIGPYLDYVAQSVGFRIVYALDGSAYAMSVETAGQVQADNLENNTHPLMGGPGIHPEDLGFIWPSSVRVDFPQAAWDSWANIGGVTPVFPELELLDSNGSDRVLIHPSPAFYDDKGDWLNEQGLTDLAYQYATDFYGWQSSGLDSQWFGIVPWTPEGLEDYIEWTYLRNKVCTRIQRFPYPEGDQTTTRYWRDSIAVLNSTDAYNPYSFEQLPTYTIFANNLVTIDIVDDEEIPVRSIDYAFGRIQSTPDPHISAIRLDWQGLRVCHTILETEEITLETPPPDPAGLNTLPNFTLVGAVGSSTLTGGGTAPTGSSGSSTLTGTGTAPRALANPIEPAGPLPVGGPGLGTPADYPGNQGTLVPSYPGYGQLDPQTPNQGTLVPSFGNVGTLESSLECEGTSIVYNLPGSETFPIGTSTSEECFGPEPDLQFVDSPEIKWNIKEDAEGRIISITPVLQTQANQTPGSTVSSSQQFCLDTIVITDGTGSTVPLPGPPGSPGTGGININIGPTNNTFNVFPIINLTVPTYVTWLATFNAFFPTNLTFPTLGIIATNDLGPVFYGRICFFTSGDSGFTYIGWQGFKVYADIAFIGGGLPAPDLGIFGGEYGVTTEVSYNQSTLSNEVLINLALESTCVSGPITFAPGSAGGFGSVGVGEGLWLVWITINASFDATEVGQYLTFTLSGDCPASANCCYASCPGEIVGSCTLQTIISGGTALVAGEGAGSATASYSGIALRIA